ncbi:anthranilate synthase component I family protein [Niabella insulamsoli]|uniref:anthranilate synthase component I family protein n=1 Tax=Niabella insulamsoli TaxID=3144874 RepID=UPI0031FDF144
MYGNFEVSDTSVFKQKVLNWLRPFNTFCYLDSNKYDSGYDLLVAAGVASTYTADGENALAALQDFIHQKKRWLFGHLNYELTTFEKISRAVQPDFIKFPQLNFFEPQILLRLKKNELYIDAEDAEGVFKSIQGSSAATTGHIESLPPVQHKMSKASYLATLRQLQQHLQRGDCYEINFCQEFFMDKAVIDPFVVFNRLCEKSPNPFSALYRVDDKWLLCASPERFLKKEGRQIISQPIKGTLRREGDTDAERQRLRRSEKDRAENVMVVDLVRNDLSRICEEGSVVVDELFGVYSFPQVHQMISTVSGQLREEVDFKNIIDATFPMGSMTGAPKVKVMQLIDRYEQSRRGIFSGALGYINPQEDFDFNVVIRSIMYNQSTQYLSFQAGGGITIYSDPEKEWEESLLKANAIKEVLTAV